MELSDEQLTSDGHYGSGAEAQTSVIADAESMTMPKIVPATSAMRESEETTVVGTGMSKPQDAVAAPSPAAPFVGELISSVIKTLFVALSLFAMLCVILAVSFPFRSMQILNSLGMSERAVDFAERYISRELRAYDADTADDIGNYAVLSRTPELTNDQFVEALYVAVNLSEKLMTASYRTDDTARGRYYAERLEKYTRIYLSLNGLSAVSLKKDYDNITSMPTVALRPIVYSSEHDMRVRNYRARAYLGTTDYIAYNNRSDRMGVLQELSQRGNSFDGLNSDTDDGKAQILDDFADFADQLGAYLDVEFLKLGVENDLSKKVDVDADERVMRDIPIVSETAVKSLYYGKLRGDEFSIFFTPKSDMPEMSGYSRLFTQISSYFSKFAQWAVDIEPRSNGDAMSGKLHKLYWLRTLSSAAQRFWYMELLLYYSHNNFGQNGEAIRNGYPTCQEFSRVTYNGQSSYLLPEVYNLELKQYITQYQS